MDDDDEDEDEDGDGDPDAPPAPAAPLLLTSASSTSASHCWPQPPPTSTGHGEYRGLARDDVQMMDLDPEEGGSECRSSQADIVTWLWVCVRFPDHRNDFFMPHVLSILGKKKEQGSQPCMMIVQSMMGFDFPVGGITDNG
ncbi:hypothetical protein Q9233_011191 [Columba guinea]|nr:hypothetical protein Q9233_011191 [Columba guinea]